MDYDVIIAGGSFGGLAAATQLRGKHVLLVEPRAIGAVQTSACGTLWAVLEATRTTDSLLQLHDHFVLHLGDRTVEYALPYPFCTFDYRTFCYRLLAQCDVEILHATVLGHRGHLVYTTKGVFDGEILIDATGWRASLATNSQARLKFQRGKSFGLETVIPIQESGLHFYYDPRRMGLNNIGWLFPTGASSRAGFASYLGRTNINQALNDFIRQNFGDGSIGRHGGYFPYLCKPETSDNVFRVGDAAGQCLPFSGEGIRPALYFGAIVGRLARRVLVGEMRGDEALRIYRKLTKRHYKGYTFLRTAQKVIPGLPIRWIENIASFIQRPYELNVLLRWYWNLIDPTQLASEWEKGVKPLIHSNINLTYARPSVYK
jgi:menaquinone-9 beta-reductase